MDDHAQRVDRVAIDQHAHFYKVAFAVADLVVIERGIAARNALQPVVEIEHHFVERQFIDDLRTTTDIGQLLLNAAPVLTQFQYAAQIFVGAVNRRLNPRLLNFRDAVNVGHIGGVVQIHTARIFGLRPAQLQLVHNRRRGGDKVQVKFARQALLNDFKVQQPQEPAAKAKAQRRAAFGFKAE